MPIEEYAFGLEQEIKTLKAALAAAEQRIANAARQADHDAGVIADLGAKMEAAEARAERAEARIAETCADMEDRLDIDDNGRDCWSFGGTVVPKTVKKWLAALRGGKAAQP